MLSFSTVSVPNYILIQKNQIDMTCVPIFTGVQFRLSNASSGRKTKTFNQFFTSTHLSARVAIGNMSISIGKVCRNETTNSLRFLVPDDGQWWYVLRLVFTQNLFSTRFWWYRISKWKLQTVRYDQMWFRFFTYFFVETI